MSAGASSTLHTRTTQLGRFKIIRLLGKGNQSEVYLAHDPHLERDVAIKTLHFASAEDRQANIANLLDEARTVSRFHHPNIVTLYDAGEVDGQPYLVFEYVEGLTLAQLLKQKGPLSNTQTAELTIQVLDALVYAHAQGIVHHDIKPSNVLIGANGMARVMDFGIAERIGSSAAKSGFLRGTPSYMAPEYIRDEAYTPQSDLFSLGMMMYELLAGRPPISGHHAHDVLKRILSEKFVPPSTHNDVVDELMDDLVLRALKKEPSERYADASTMKRMVARYLSPDEAEGGEVVEGQPGTLEFLLRRMRVKSDFPALSESISAINRLARSDKESVNKLSNSILKDFALTNKLLKLVNSAMYGQFGNRSISTISRAVVILGFDAVRSIALSLMLFENLQNKTHAHALKEEFIRSLFSAMLARSLSSRMQIKDGEEAFLCSMFHNLGRMLSLFYFPEETAEIRKLMQIKQVKEEPAAIQILGIGFEELGAGVARNWGFPDVMMFSMRRLGEDKIKKGSTNHDRLRILAGFSNELAELITDTPSEERSAAVTKLSMRYGEALSVTEKQVGALVEKSMQEIAQFSAAVNVNLQQSHFAGQAAKWTGRSGTTQTSHQSRTDQSHTPLAATVLHEPKLDFDSGTPGSSRRSSEEIQSILTSGLQDISNSLIDDNVSVNDILRMILETMYSAMGFAHALFCIKDGRKNAMVGKFGFGEGVQELIQAFEIPLQEQPDVFQVALKNNADILISDIQDPKISSRIPIWYKSSIPAQTFLIFPIVIKGKPLGMIYADRPKAGDIVISEKELSLLKSLRNQAVLAIKQSL